MKMCYLIVGHLYVTRFRDLMVVYYDTRVIKINRFGPVHCCKTVGYLNFKKNKDHWNNESFFTVIYSGLTYSASQKKMFQAVAGHCIWRAQ